MPRFESKQGRAYDIDGKHLIWHPEAWEGEPALPAVRLPLRIKMGVVLDIGEGKITASNENMRAVLLRIAPAIEPVLDEMDVNDFQDMFATWQAVYNGRVGVSLGESSPSGASSRSTEGQPSSTSARASASRSPRSAGAGSAGQKRSA